MLFNFNHILNDAPQPWQIGFQDSAAPGFSGIVELHNTLFFYLIVVGVFWVLNFNKKYNSNTIEYNNSIFNSTVKMSSNTNTNPRHSLITISTKKIIVVF